MTLQPQPESGDLWSRFSADPRRMPSVRASDADRDVAAQALNAAFSDGRLDQSEHAERLSTALAAKTLGDLPPLLSDIVVSARPAPPPAPRTAEERRGRIRSGAVRSWLGLAVLFNVIWVATWLLSGSAPYYYWPIWPMIGTAIPLLVAWIGSGTLRDPSPAELEQRALRDQGRELRQQGRDLRAQGRALRDESRQMRHELRRGRHDRG